MAQLESDKGGRGADQSAGDELAQLDPMEALDGRLGHVEALALGTTGKPLAHLLVQMCWQTVLDRWAQNAGPVDSSVLAVVENCSSSQHAQ